jgi:hypothetical protein
VNRASIRRFDAIFPLGKGCLPIDFVRRWPDLEDPLTTLAQALYLDSEFGVEHDLPRAGSTLENPFVYDAVAKDLKDMAEQGLVEIVAERVSRVDPALIDRLSFRRLR